MRISYWSADVCSSDLAALQSRLDGERSEQDRRRAGDGDRPVADRGEEAVVVGDRGEAEFRQRIEMLAKPVDGLADAVEAEGTVEHGRNQRGVLRRLGHTGEAPDLCSRRAVPGWFLWGHGRTRRQAERRTHRARISVVDTVFSDGYRSLYTLC